MVYSRGRGFLCNRAYFDVLADTICNITKEYKECLFFYVVWGLSVNGCSLFSDLDAGFNGTYL